MDRTEEKKWRVRTMAAFALGFVFFLLPLTREVKFLAAVPLYIIFVYVAYRYICIKKANAAGENSVVDVNKDKK